MLSLSVYFICFPLYILTIVKYCLLLPAVNITGNVIRNYVVCLEATVASNGNVGIKGFCSSKKIVSVVVDLMVTGSRV